MVLFSGGKDSAYMIQRIRREHPALRLLAFANDNTFMSPVARQNVERLAAQLDLDHVWVRTNRAFVAKLFAYCLTHLNDEGSYGTLDLTDGELMLDTARTLAAEKQIPLILCGYAIGQVRGAFGPSCRWECPRERMLTDRTETAGLPLKDIFLPEEMGPWWRPQAMGVPPERIARMLFPLFAWNLEEEEIKRSVAEWGLLNERQCSPIVTNHQLIPLLGVVDVHRVGFSSFEKEFCKMVRQGKADLTLWRNTFELLEYCSKTGTFIRHSSEEMLRKIGLTPEQVGIHWH